MKTLIYENWKKNKEKNLFEDNIVVNLKKPSQPYQSSERTEEGGNRTVHHQPEPFPGLICNQTGETKGTLYGRPRLQLDSVSKNRSGRPGRARN